MVDLRRNDIQCEGGKPTPSSQSLSEAQESRRGTDQGYETDSRCTLPQYRIIPVAKADEELPAVPEGAFPHEHRQLDQGRKEKHDQQQRVRLSSAFRARSTEIFLRQQCKASQPTRWSSDRDETQTHIPYLPPDEQAEDVGRCDPKEAMDVEERQPRRDSPHLQGQHEQQSAVVQQQQMVSHRLINVRQGAWRGIGVCTDRVFVFQHPPVLQVHKVHRKVLWRRTPNASTVSQFVVAFRTGRFSHKLLPRRLKPSSLRCTHAAAAAHARRSAACKVDKFYNLCPQCPYLPAAGQWCCCRSGSGSTGYREREVHQAKNMNRNRPERVGGKQMRRLSVWLPLAGG